MTSTGGLRERVVGNTALLGGVFLFNAVAGVATSILLAHLLTVGDLGLYGFWFRVYSWLAAFAVFLLPQVLVRYVAELRGAGREGAAWLLLRWAMGLQLLLSSLVLVGAAGLVLLRPGLATMPLLLVLVAFLLHALTVVLEGYLRGCQVFGPVARGVMAAALVRIGALLLLFVVGADLVLALAVYIMGQVVHLAVLMRAPMHPPGSAADPGFPRRRVLRFGLTMGAAGFLSLFTWNYVEVFILGWTWAGDPRLEAELAFYTLAIALCMLPNRFAKAVAGALSPAFAELKGSGATGSIRSSYRTGTILATAAGAWIAINLALIAPPLFALLFPASLAPAAPVFQILMIPTLFLSMNYAGGVLLPTLDGHRFQLLVSAASAPLVLILGFLIIPSLGSMGAASVNAIMQSACVAASILWLSRARALPFPLRPVAMIVLAAIVAGAPLLHPGWREWWPLLLLMSGIIYTILLRLFGVLGPGERDLMENCTGLLPPLFRPGWSLAVRGICTS